MIGIFLRRSPPSPFVYSRSIIRIWPFLSRLISILCTGGEETLRLELKKGSVALVEVDGEPLPGAGLLRWAVAPRILRALDGASD